MIFSWWWWVSLVSSPGYDHLFGPWIFNGAACFLSVIQSCFDWPLPQSTLFCYSQPMAVSQKPRGFKHYSISYIICLVFSSRLTFNTMVFSSTPTSKYNNIGYCTYVHLSCFVLLTKDSLALVASKVLIIGWLLILWLYDWKEGDSFAPYHHTCT